MCVCVCVCVLFGGCHDFGSERIMIMEERIYSLDKIGFWGAKKLLMMGCFGVKKKKKEKGKKKKKRERGGGGKKKEDEGKK